MSEPAALRGQLVRRLQGAHALKAGALRMFDPMLAAAAAARACRVEDEEMAATIDRNWTNVLTLTLASRGLPTLRPPEHAG